MQAVIVYLPHNPTGEMISQAEWQHLCSICHSSGTYLFSDEMYRGLEHRDTAMLPTAADTYERGISLCGMSKALSMPGLRIGWLATQDTQLLNSVMQLKDYTTICNSAPSEVCIHTVIHFINCFSFPFFLENFSLLFFCFFA